MGASYFRFLFISGVRSIPSSFAVMILAALLCLGILAPVSEAVPGGALDRRTYQFALENVDSLLSTDAADTMPAELVALMSRERDALEAACLAPDARGMYTAAVQYLDAQLEQVSLGYLVTDAMALEAQRQLLLSLSQMKEDPGFASSDSSAYPTLHYLAWIPAMIPSVAFAIPSLVAATRAASRRSGCRLLSRAPMGRTCSSALSVAASCAASLALLGIAALPAGLISFVRNGPGIPSYPVVFIRDGTVVESSVAAVLLGFVILYAFVSLTVASLVECARAWTNHAWPGCLLAVLFITLPLMPSFAAYLAATPEQLLALSQGAVSPPLFAAASWLPMTYLDIANVVGSATSGNGRDLLPVVGASFARGCFVLAVTSCLLFALSLLAGKVLNGSGITGRENAGEEGDATASLDVDALSLRRGGHAPLRRGQLLPGRWRGAGAHGAKRLWKNNAPAHAGGRWRVQGEWVRRSRRRNS